jgi:hypothetical protein
MAEVAREAQSECPSMYSQVSPTRLDGALRAGAETVS